MNELHSKIIDFQPLFGKGDRAPLGNEDPDLIQRWKASLNWRYNISAIDSRLSFRCACPRKEPSLDRYDHRHKYECTEKLNLLRKATELTHHNLLS